MPKLTSLLRSIPPPDYWEFPAIIRSFKSVGYGEVRTIDGREWRVRGGDYVLLSKPDPLLSIPKGANPARIRSLSWSANCLPPSVPRKSNGWTYAASSTWKPPTSQDRTMRKGIKECVKEVEMDPASLINLLDVWVADKKEAKPSAMVVRGHYAAMVKDAGIKFIGYADPEGKVLGAVGYTEQDGHYCISYAKHVYGVWWLARFLWMRTIGTLLKMGAKSVVCGDTADRLKMDIGLDRAKQYKVDFSKIRV